MMYTSVAFGLLLASASAFSPMGAKARGMRLSMSTVATPTEAVLATVR
jgi:hypothetical protein